MTIQVLSSLFLILSIAGGYVAYLYGRKVRRFRWSEYVAILVVPTLCSVSLVYFYGVKIIYFFFASCIVGFGLEYILGLAYHKTLNRRLWAYNDRFSISGYTSLLTIPIWGCAGIVFFILGKSIGV